MIDFQLFIGDQKADLFKDEGLQIQDTIQDAKDIGSIYTTYSSTFTLPATDINNEIFKHYYNANIIEGFDGRLKKPATIKLSGFDRFNGYIELQDVRLNENKPSQYTVYFVGLTSELKDVLKDDKLSDLVPLSEYDHDYTEATAELGFSNFLETTFGAGVTSSSTLVSTSDFCYPFITHSKRYVYTTELFEVEDDGTVSTRHLDYKQLKPAIRLNRIVEAIQEQYNITFSSDFLDNNTTFNSLFMWLHRNKGIIVSDNLFNLALQLENDFNFVSGDDNIPNFGLLQTGSVFVGTGTNQSSWEVTYDIIITGAGVISYQIINQVGGAVLLSESGVNADNETLTAFIDLDSTFTTLWKPLLVIETEDAGITQLDVELTLKNIITGDSPSTTTGNYDLDGGSVVAVGRVIIQEQIPSMTVINFLTSLFKLFNLTAYVQADGTIFIEPLDDFYDAGNTYDITNLIDIKQSNVSRLKPFSEISFEFEDPKTFLIEQRNVKTDSVYGNLRYKLEDNENATGEVYSGGTYAVKVGFDKMLYERLTDDNGDLTRVCYGRYVDEKQEPTFGKPLIFITSNPTDLGSNDIEFENSGNIATEYIRPMNALPEQSINFGAELDEFSLQQNDNSLFQNYYANYITRIFSKNSRMYDFEAYVNLDFVNKYNLNDALIINNRKFNINDIEIDLKTGKAKLNLINILSEAFSATAARPAPTPPERPFNVILTDDGGGQLTVDWTDAQDDTRIKDTFIEVIDAGVVVDSNVEAFGTETTVFTGLSTPVTYTVTVQHRLDDGTESGTRKGENIAEINLTS